MSPAFSFSTGLDVLIAVLLIATIVYAVSLNRKLTRLRDDRGEMEALIVRLVEATDRAQTGIEGLREHAAELGEQLDQSIHRSRGRVDELAFLIERAESLSGRLDGSIAAARPLTPVPTDAPATAGPSDAAKPSFERQSTEVPPEEAGLLKTLQGLR